MRALPLSALPMGYYGPGALAFARLVPRNPHRCCLPSRHRFLRYAPSAFALHRRQHPC